MKCRWPPHGRSVEVCGRAEAVGDGEFTALVVESTKVGRNIKTVAGVSLDIQNMEANFVVIAAVLKRLDNIVKVGIVDKRLAHEDEAVFEPPSVVHERCAKRARPPVP
jgi:hypothetical protein